VVAKPDCVCVVESYLVIWYMIASLSDVWDGNSRVVCDCKNYFVCIIANTYGNSMIAKKRPEPVCGCNYFACVIATRSYLWLQHDWVCVVESYLVIWLFMIASLISLWLQTEGSFLWLQTIFVCVIATRSYLWLHHDWVCVGKSYWLFMIASLGSVWLQNNRVVCDWKNYFMCVIAKTIGYFMIAKKKNWTSLWLQLFCVCDCNQKLFVVASWLSLCG
jgi:hypothetical protein